MPDHRKILQSSFEPNRRHENYGEALTKIRIRGIRSHVDTVIDIESPVTAFCGVNGSGKSTVLQLAAAAYQSHADARYYFSTFVLAGTLDQKSFQDDASVEFSYAAQSTGGAVTNRTLTVSRSGSAWSGYDRQPKRSVKYVGTAFYTPHSDRNPYFKSLVQDATFTSRLQTPFSELAAQWVSQILLCKYDVAQVNLMRKKFARSYTRIFSATREGGVGYSESNMGTGEARLYALVWMIENTPERSLLLIEEPEASLHPSAQYELGRYLADVAQRRRLQFLMTTHSEYLMLAIPEKSRIYLKRESNNIVPLPGVGVRQAISLMDNVAIPSLYILVEDDVAESIIVELLRLFDTDFLKTTRRVVAGDVYRIQQTMAVFKEQNMPICAVRDADKGHNLQLKIFKLFGTEPPEKEIFKSNAFRIYFRDEYKVDWSSVDVRNRDCDHHRWFEPLEQWCSLTRSELLAVAARHYLKDVSDTDKTTLVQQIRASTT